MRAQVGIVGAGPAGLFLAHLLHKAGVDAIVVEKHARTYVEARVRAGVLEQITVDLLRQLGIGGRMEREGLVHRGTNIAVDGAMFHVDFAALTGGATIMVYGQSEVMKDLGIAADKLGLNIVYDAADVELREMEGACPMITWRKDGATYAVTCEFIVGCDGYHGVSRTTIPASVLNVFERVYPFGWLGVLADVPPCENELVYANHERGFALASMRSPTRSRYYLQCAADENIEDWPDERFWDEVCVRLGPAAGGRVTRGASFEKSIAPLRSFVAEPMRWNRLFLAGDSAHIVPPTGAKGLNLAVSDVLILADAFARYYQSGDAHFLDTYSARALARVWKAERFSWWFTGLTHRFPNTEPFDRRMQVAELDYIRHSTAAQTTLAENYVGLPL